MLTEEVGQACCHGDVCICVCVMHAHLCACVCVYVCVCVCVCVSEVALQELLCYQFTHHKIQNNQDQKYRLPKSNSYLNS